MIMYIHYQSSFDKLIKLYDSADIKYKKMFDLKVHNFVKFIYNLVLQDIEGFTTNDHIPIENFDMLYMMYLNTHNAKDADDLMLDLVYMMFNELHVYTIPNGFTISGISGMLEISNT